MIRQQAVGYILVEDLLLQPGARRVSVLLQVTQVGELLLRLLLFLALLRHSPRAQVFSRRRLNVTHQLSVAPVCRGEAQTPFGH